MIERLYLKNHFGFDEVDLEFSAGLNAFTGPSGAGKSVLMGAFLTLFGLSDSDASIIEATIDMNLPLEDVGIESDEPNVFKFMKNKSARYFINSQSISKKNIKSVCTSFIKHLSVREDKEFSNERLLSLIDAVASKKESLHVKNLEEYKKVFVEFTKYNEELKSILEEEKKVEELKEYAQYEISKIDEVSPKVGEDEELMSFKKMLSKKEKLEDAIGRASGIFEFESAVYEVFELDNTKSELFDEAMNELRSKMEVASERLEELEGIDVEELLDRIEKISALKTRYGSIEEVLEYKEKRQEELAHYENLAFEKKDLEAKCEKLKKEVEKLADNLSKNRGQYLPSLKKLINSYLAKLYMQPVELIFTDKELQIDGKDSLHVELNNVDIKKVSSGEFNRLRLAFIATDNELLGKNSGILILDEIDANLSGKESMSVANVLKEISNKYQIFAISHQPQLSSRADTHYFVHKEQGIGKVKVLEQNDRVNELARMVSGEDITNEALEFATTLLQ